MQKIKEIPVRYLKGIGPQRAKILEKLGVKSIEDLFYYFPHRYEDRRNFLKISELKEAEYQTIKGEVLARGEKTSWRRRGFKILEVVVSDSTGKIFCVWFNQPYLKNYFKPGTHLILYGRVQRYENRLQMTSPEFEIIDEASSYDTGRIVPVYPLLNYLSQRSFRLIMHYALKKYIPYIKDFLPYDIRARNNLLNLAQSLINIHFPTSFELQKKAYQRLSFEEFFLFQLPLALRKVKTRCQKGISHRIDGKWLNYFILNLPFKLTCAQERVSEEIKKDMASSYPMQRLLQGDVGSGKTVVATLACVIALQTGYQVAFMVPTEILAKQCFEVVAGYLYKINKDIKITLLTSGLKPQERKKIYQQIRTGKISLVVGTHALLEEEVEFKNLGLVVIDEQHKFGVSQRALLPKKGVNPDVLIMTATPIPRTLAITLYGDLDISVINELPKQRSLVKTLLFSSQELDYAYTIAKNEIKKGNQVFIVYPVIEESYTLDILGAKRMYNEFKKNEFRDFRIGLIHGKMKQNEQDYIMEEFKNHRLDILVATTVLEVGIDIPDATCMIIHYAERFGLAQLHQLRGRIGRGGQQAYCLLISDAQTQEARARLEAMLKYNDGFKIAEEDLKIRGPGEFFGKRQHGLSDLKIADPVSQLDLLKKAKEEAYKLAQLDSSLNFPQHSLLKEKLLERFPQYEKLILVA